MFRLKQKEMARAIKLWTELHRVSMDELMPCTLHVMKWEQSVSENRIKRQKKNPSKLRHVKVDAGSPLHRWKQPELTGGDTALHS